MPAQTVIQIRRDTAANWESTDPTLASGEIGFDTTNNQIKIGNGTDEWTVLDYASGGASVQISETAPVDPDTGNVWFNSTDGRAYIYYDSTWVDLNPGIAGPAGKFTVSETAPADPSAGDGWFDSANAKLFIYYDNFWVEATSNYIGPSGEDGLVISTDAPSVTDVLWLDTDEEPDVPVPAGGAEGQVLAKASATDYDSEWVDLPTPPSGNAIINGAFDIWQRGTSFTPAAGSEIYTADRFYAQRDGSGATVTVSRQSFTPGTAPVAGYEAEFFLRYAQTVAGTGGTFNQVVQKVEDVRSFAGQTVTFSFWAKAAASTTIQQFTGQQFGTGGSTVVYIPGATHSITTNWARYTSSFTIPSISGKTIGTNSRLDMAMLFPNNTAQTIDIWGVQLESGPVATPFRRNANSLQGELAACQRYYIRWSQASAFSAIGGFGYGLSSTNAETFFNPLVTMRVAPTSIDFANVAASDGTNRTNTTSVSLTGGTDNRVNVRLVTSSGLTQYRGYIAETTSAGNGFIGLSAEL